MLGKTIKLCYINTEGLLLYRTNTDSKLCIAHRLRQWVLFH